MRTLRLRCLAVFFAPLGLSAQPAPALPELRIDPAQSKLDALTLHFPTIAALDDLRVLQSGRMPIRPEKLNDEALITYLNTTVVPEEVSKWAFEVHWAAEVSNLQQFHGDDNTFPVPADSSDPKFEDKVAGKKKGPAPTPAQTQKITELGKSIGLLVRPGEVKGLPDAPRIYTKHIGRLLNLCPDADEYDSRMIEKSGTGFVISPRHIATAGHCVEIVGKNPRIIFGYTAAAQNESQTDHPGNDMYFGKGSEILSLKLVTYADPTKLADKGDWAIYEIVGTTTARPPLPLNEGPLISSKEQNLVMIGHPCGFPLRAAIKGNILSHNPENFATDLDAFIGNSGSPVFNESTWKVEGILVKGGKDYRLVTKMRCEEWVWITDLSGAIGEKVGRIFRISQALKKLR